MTIKSVYYVVSDYGADPTGATDSTAQIQAAINAARSRGVGMPNGIVDFEGGVFKSGALDCTGCATLELRGGGVGGAVINAAQAGAPMIDMTGSQSCLVKGLSLYAVNSALQPSAGILWAASSANADSTKNRLEGITIDGFFSSANMCMIGTADNVMLNCDFGQGRGDRPALVHSDQADWFISSPFKALTPNGASSCSDNTFVQVEIHGTNQAPTSGWSLYYRNALAVRHFGGNISSDGGRADVLLQGTCKRISYFGTQFWTQTPPPQYLFDDQGTGTEIYAVGCSAGPYVAGMKTGAFSGSFTWV